MWKWEPCRDRTPVRETISKCPLSSTACSWLANRSFAVVRLPTHVSTQAASMEWVWATCSSSMRISWPGCSRRAIGVISLGVIINSSWLEFVFRSSCILFVPAVRQWRTVDPRLVILIYSIGLIEYANTMSLIHLIYVNVEEGAEFENEVWLGLPIHMNRLVVWAMWILSPENLVYIPFRLGSDMWLIRVGNKKRSAIRLIAVMLRPIEYLLSLGKEICPCSLRERSRMFFRIMA